MFELNSPSLCSTGGVNAGLSGEHGSKDRSKGNCFISVMMMMMVVFLFVLQRLLLLCFFTKAKIADHEVDINVQYFSGGEILIKGHGRLFGSRRGKSIGERHEIAE